MRLINIGVTRRVLLIGPFAVKFPKSLRGYLANQSEWRQRKRPDVNRPIISIFHLAIVFRRATESAPWIEPHDNPYQDFGAGYSDEEAKGSSWGRVNGRLVLIDFDRAWQNPKPVIGWLYYWNQARLARKWMKLETANE